MSLDSLAIAVEGVGFDSYTLAFLGFSSVQVGVISPNPDAEVRSAWLRTRGRRPSYDLFTKEKDPFLKQLVVFARLEKLTAPWIENNEWTFLQGSTEQVFYTEDVVNVKVENVTPTVEESDISIEEARVYVSGKRR